MFIKRDRRKYPRTPIELKVEYSKVNTFLVDYTMNISKGGTFIKTDRPFDVGTEFIFFLHVPEVKEPIRIKGKVQWVLRKEDAKSGEEPGMGIKFIFESEEDKRKIEEIVEYLIKSHTRNI